MACNDYLAIAACLLLPDSGSSDGVGKVLLRGFIPRSMVLQLYTAYSQLVLDATNSYVVSLGEGWCECPAAATFCTHQAALVHTAADLVRASGRIPGAFPQLISSTSRAQMWGVPTGKLDADVSMPIDRYIFQMREPQLM